MYRYRSKVSESFVLFHKYDNTDLIKYDYYQRSKITEEITVLTCRNFTSPVIKPILL